MLIASCVGAVFRCWAVRIVSGQHVVALGVVCAASSVSVAVEVLPMHNRYTCKERLENEFASPALLLRSAQERYYMHETARDTGK